VNGLPLGQPLNLGQPTLGQLPTLGQPPPDFELRDHHGQPVRLSAFRGEQAVLVVFYPFAFSGVCTGELRALRDRLPTIQRYDVALLAVSCDPVYALRVFADREELAYPLLSDFWPHGAVAQAYGVFDAERGCAGRATFIVDRAGALRWSVHNERAGPRSVDDYERVLAGISTTTAVSSGAIESS
jgi:peroxiredoxin